MSDPKVRSPKTSPETCEGCNIPFDRNGLFNRNALARYGVRRQFCFNCWRHDLRKT